MPQAFSPNPFMPLKVLDFCNLNQSVASSFLQETAELTGIKNLLNSPLKTLSGGELQRVLLTRALLNKPNVLILDEPAQNLDVGGQMQLYKLIQNIHQQQGCAVLKTDIISGRTTNFRDNDCDDAHKLSLVHPSGRRINH
jgi:zinc transport system ATP-binding protein